MRIVRLSALCVVMLSAVSANAVPASAVSHHSTSGNVTTVRWGPFTVPGAMSENEPGMIENGIVREGGCHGLSFCINRPMTKPCQNCFVTRIVPNLVDADTGETINFSTGGMLHHAVNLNWSRPDVTCPPGAGNVINFLGLAEGGNDRFFATGNERTIFQAPPGYGIPVRHTDDWGLIIDLMNMMPEPRNVALEYTFTWVTGAVKPLRSVWLDVNNCGSSLFDVPMGYSDTHWTWQSTIAGRVVVIAGHVHDNGISVAAENVTRHRVICASRAGYEKGSVFVPVGPGAGGPAHPRRWWHMTKSDHPDVSLESYEGHIAGMISCAHSAHLKIGDTIGLHTQYNMGDMAHGGHDVMGIMVAYVDQS